MGPIVKRSLCCISDMSDLSDMSEMMSDMADNSHMTLPHGTF